MAAAVAVAIAAVSIALQTIAAVVAAATAASVITTAAASSSSTDAACTAVAACAAAATAAVVVGVVDAQRGVVPIAAATDAACIHGRGYHTASARIHLTQGNGNGAGRRVW